MSLTDQLNNQLVGGGLVLMASGAVMATLRHIPGQVYRFVKRRLTVEVEVASADPLFDYVTLWLDNHPYSKKSRRLTATTATRVPIANADDDSCSAPGDHSSARIARVFLAPAPGTHVFVYRGNLMTLNRNRDSGGGPTSGKLMRSQDFGMKLETYTLTLFGKNQKVIRKLIEEIVQFGSPPAHSIRLFTSRFGYWQSSGIMKPRSIKSVVLPDNLIDRVVADAKKFLASSDRYRDLGIPWHRGYLLHGVPGSGKTSLVAALSGELGMDMYLLNLSGTAMDDEKLSTLMADVRPGTIVLMEDIDCTMPDRDSTDVKRVTLSGLLNCLDGIQSREGCMIFMTTNFRGKLDSALTRPGRVDMDIQFGLATHDQILRLRDRLAPKLSDAEALALDGKTMAEVQQALLDEDAVKG